jgi:hypothetical protein
MVLRRSRVGCVEDLGRRSIDPETVDRACVRCVCWDACGKFSVIEEEREDGMRPLQNAPCRVRSSSSINSTSSRASVYDGELPRI